MNPTSLPPSRVQQAFPAKICGLTRPDEACACMEAGASAIGLIFYPPSPRFVSIEQAQAIREALPPDFPLVGVFVDETAENIQSTITACRLNGVQLHGNESPALAERFFSQGMLTIKTLFWNRNPLFSDAAAYRCSAFLVECGKGPFPGGNAQAWNWAAAKPLAEQSPLILAGGLTPENVVKAIRDACPDAIDVSSGVEFCPGRKDLAKVRMLLQATRNPALPKPSRRIFS
ncbi:phosphoribosylanthranilate isomerase [Desulfatirhabdium butyrativorans]|uniref:phosphoribosylanthranilate isomerase n=1 Tax=Desulfatirhabdium butyrativorans TaxID=340467 RepID=UPI00040AC3D2|nr:phosphoribosylanthranilate isomerase [Desulfatirhabdium butyrativorans]